MKKRAINITWEIDRDISITGVYVGVYASVRVTGARRCAPVCEQAHTQMKC